MIESSIVCTSVDDRLGADRWATGGRYQPQTRPMATTTVSGVPAGNGGAVGVRDGRIRRR